MSGGPLKVKSTTAFGAIGKTGTLKIDGIDTPCSYTVTDSTHFALTGCTTGIPDDKVTVTMTTATTVSGAGQDPSRGFLTVSATSGFDPSGSLTVAGGTGTCNYSVVDGTTFAITGCTGTPKDGAAVARVTNLPGVYKWNDSTSNWDFQIAGIPSGTTLPVSPATGDYFQMSKAAPATTAVDGGPQNLGLGTLTVKSTTGFNAGGGTFKVDGLSGTCTYAATTATTFTGVTACTGMADNKATVTSAAATPEFVAGLLKWDGRGLGSQRARLRSPPPPPASDHQH